jgi:DNA-binding MarR family transcriptional regulator
MSTPETPTHTTSLAFLLSQVGAYSAQLFAARLEPLGVTPRAYGILSHLAREGGQTQQRLADALGIHRNSMVNLVDELERADWARRHRSRRDRRAFEVRLTPAGRAVVDRVQELVEELDAQLSAALSQTERDAMTTLLVKVAAGSGLAPGVHPHLRT